MKQPRITHGMTRIMLLAASAVGAVSVSGGTVRAQSADDFVAALSGTWYVFEPAQSGGDGPCKVELKADAAEGGERPAAATGCAGGMETAATWRIDEGTLILADAAGAQISRLGGNQTRMTGNLDRDGRGIILERAQGDAYAQALSTALRRHKCFYFGTTAECASTEARARPKISQSQGQVQLAVNLTAYSQPRRGSANMGVVPEGSCVVVDQCLAASDGLWCRARFGETIAWLAKAGVRQGEWPVVTYVDGCTAPAEGGLSENG